DSNWTNAANWSGSVVPQTGFDLVFPAGATNLNAVDDFPAGTSFSSITIGAQGYTLSGSALELTGAVRATFSSGSSTNSIPMTLDGATATVTTGGELILSGVIAGGAGLNVSGGGTLALGAANTYTGLTSISGAGTTLLVDGTIGAAQINAGAVLGGTGT